MPKKLAQLNVAGRERLNREIFTQAVKRGLQRHRNSPEVRSLGMALVVPVRAPAAIVTPTAETKEIPNFPFPILDDADMPTGEGYEIIDVTVLVWLAVQDVRWDFMKRQLGTVVWMKPPIVVENASLGMASIVLPQDSYEFLPLARVR